MGLIFLWAFVDKLFGLGFSTSSENAWIAGGSPTSGYLMNATRGPFAELFQSLAGNMFIDWIFMLGLFGIGVAFIIKKYMMFAAISGSIMMILMWLSTFPPTTNPILDYHIVYVFALLVIAFESKKTKYIK